MAINPEAQYVGKISPSSDDYPYGRARNITIPGDGTGTPLDSAWVNDLFGLQQALLSMAGIVPNGSPETATNSQYFEALSKIVGRSEADVSGLRALTMVKPGVLVRIEGRSEAGDGGANVYIIEAVDASPDDNVSIVKLDDGTHQARALFPEGVLRAEQFGFLPLVDAKEPFENALSLARTLQINDGAYGLSGPVTITALKDYVVAGRGRKTTLNRDFANSNFITFNKVRSLDFRNLTLSKKSAGSADSGHCLVLLDQTDGTVSDLTITEFGGVGSGVIAYSSDGTPFENFQIHNSAFQGDRALSDNTNGFLIEGGKYCQMSNLYVTGAESFAVEYKNKQRHSTVSDIITVNSKFGLGYGQTTATTDDVSFCVATNYTSEACDYGVVLGDADYNGFANGVVNGNGHTGPVSFGARGDGVSTGNAFWGLLTVGDVDQPVRWQASASNNYVQIASHDAAHDIVVLQAGASRNVTDIAHPGARSTIRTAGLLSGNPTSGPNSNPYYSHATGEYVGSLSDRWRWIHEFVSTPLTSSTQKWIFEGAGTNLLTLLGDGGDQGICVVGPDGARSFLYNEASDYWQGDFSIGGFRLFRSSWRSLEDNVTSLGIASLRFSEVFAANGTINTSDAREKEQIRDIDETEKEVALILKKKIKAFKWKDSVKEKGEKARWHFGVIAQEVGQVFSDHGLDPDDYGLFCYDEWSEERSEDGSVIVEAGDRYGIRYDELLAFIISAM